MTWTKRAAEEGADVPGLLWWSLADNYSEWNHGMTFHLRAVRRVDPKRRGSQKARHARRASPCAGTRHIATARYPGTSWTSVQSRLAESGAPLSVWGVHATLYG